MGAWGYGFTQSDDYFDARGLLAKAFRVEDENDSAAWRGPLSSRHVRQCVIEAILNRAGDEFGFSLSFDDNYLTPALYAAVLAQMCLENTIELEAAERANLIMLIMRDRPLADGVYKPGPYGEDQWAKDMLERAVGITRLLSELASPTDRPVVVGESGLMVSIAELIAEGQP
ncbi:MAG: hypothetical protein AAGF24_00045 [Cyanobacteria bacterium P01_H01_bin.121]